MEEHSFFRTRARTIDHLGREQIADCPTAISELWKNSFDAYAENVELHIFDGKISIAAIVDDGHGMNINEFKNKWLTVGTESKANNIETDSADRDGLEIRPKQGQKGIGRLSSGALGALLLLVSKRKSERFVTALIDWRLFENPFLYLQDLRIPVREFDHVHELGEQIPLLFDTLMGNIWGDRDDSNRNIRLAQAWDQFSEQEMQEGITLESTTKQKIINTLIADVFSERHFSKWPVWENKSQKGTAMFIAEIQDDLIYQLSRTPLNEADDTEILSRNRFFQTLSNFTDPFSSSGEPVVNNFSYLVKTWHGHTAKIILGGSTEFDLRNLEELEHILEGKVDENGCFYGRVKTFGNWIEDIKISPKQVYKTRKDTMVGSFHIRIGAFEALKGNSSLTAAQHANLLEQAERYSGFRIYRDGLRVMPYGREDNDYFEIEYNRTKNAGAYFWSNRRMFGRVAITRQSNPNLKDKAGREGFIDNKSSKIFREIVQHILKSTAERYFGRYSEIRKSALDNIKEQKAVLKAEEDQKKLQTKEKTRVRKAIKENMNSLIAHVFKIEELKKQSEAHLESYRIDELQSLKMKIDSLAEVTLSYSLSPLPSNLGRLEEEYRAYRKQELAARDALKDLTSIVNKALVDSFEKSDYEKALEVYRSKLSSTNNKITRLANQGKSILSRQLGDFEIITKQCREGFKNAGNDIIEELKIKHITFENALQKLDEEQIKIDIENSQRLSPYITALERISDQIDLEGLAIHSMNETLKYKEEVIRLHALAQLGITVEIIGHELQGFDSTIHYGLEDIVKGPLTFKQKQAYDNVKVAHQALVAKLQFLSPLKLSGEQVFQKITGTEIFEFIQDYFDECFKREDIKFIASKSFQKVCIRDIVSRVYPVFINLINNSQYWVQRSNNTTKKILLDVDHESGSIIIADNGPGIDLDDIDHLFTLFFTRKQRGGRGVGLYLCKQNLQAGGHTIRYETNESKKLLSGANFFITFKGMTYE